MTLQTDYERVKAATDRLSAQGYAIDPDQPGDLPERAIVPLEGHTFDRYSSLFDDDGRLDDDRFTLVWRGDPVTIISAFREVGFRVEWDGTDNDTIWVWKH